MWGVVFITGSCYTYVVGTEGVAMWAVGSREHVMRYELGRDQTRSA